MTVNKSDQITRKKYRSQIAPCKLEATIEIAHFRSSTVLSLYLKTSEQKFYAPYPSTSCLGSTKSSLRKSKQTL